MSELLDAIRNMQPSAADLFVLASVALGSGSLGFALGIMWGHDDDGPTNQPTPRSSERRKYRDRRDRDE